MSIRLNKAISELNIGLQTAVDFLEKRPELGEVKNELSFKLNDKQYEALVNAFKGDREVRTQAEKLLRKPEKKKQEKPAVKKPTQAVTTGDSIMARKEIKPLGKIDLSATEKTAQKPAQQQAPVEAPKAQEKPAEEPKAPQQEKAEQHSEQTSATAQAAQPAQQQAATEAPKAQEKPAEEPKAEQQKAEPQQQPQPVSTPEEPKTELFTLKSDRQTVTRPNVIGTIDLSAINQNTRPRKKSKEERRKERDNKGAQNSSEKKKRTRIGKERVDINDAANQPGKNVKNGKNGRPNNGGAAQGANQGNAGTGKKNGRQRGKQQPEVKEEDVARKVKETLARLTSKGTQTKKGAKYRKEKRFAAAEQRDAAMAAEAAEDKILKLTEFVTVSELATMMDIPVTQLIGTLMSVGIMVSINQRLDAETINLVADEFGFSTEYVSAEVSEAIQEEKDDENDLVPRPPIVTVMGHVDHGKTSLLDYVRNTNVIAGEAGGITQHIGAYNVKMSDGRRITFLDTPGHEAFTAMRARGTQVTDIAIIIIAADDSVMPTTKEAIAHAQAANVPMVFAINKIDKPGANPDKIRQDLSAMNLLVEEWGGKYQCQEISAKKGLGVEDLMEKVLLEAEMLDLKANPNRKATGSVIESSLDKGRGYVSTVLVSNGTLKQGDIVIAGTAWGRVKAMFNERNQRVEKAAPSEPVIILGLNGAPQAGDSFHIMETEQEAK